MTGEGNRNESLNRAAWNELQKAFLVELLVEFNDKFSVAAAMEAYEQLPDFDMLDFVNASDMFIKKAETREAFLSVSEERRSDWIKRIIELWKSN